MVTARSVVGTPSDKTHARAETRERKLTPAWQLRGYGSKETYEDDMQKAFALRLLSAFGWEESLIRMG